MTIIGLNYSPEPTGIAPYTSGTAAFLADAGHQVHVITGLPHYPQWQVAAGYSAGRGVEERVGDVRITRVPHPVPADPVGLGRIGMEAAFALRAARVRTHDGARADVVLAVSPALLSIVAAMRHSRFANTALGVVPQDLYGRALAEGVVTLGRVGAAAAAVERFLLHRAHGVVAIHDRFRIALETMGVRADRITTIRNWTHLRSHESRPEERARLRLSLGWQPDEVVAVHAGNMGRKQYLDVVVEAARLADGSTRKVRLVLLGHGSRRAHLEALGAEVRSLQLLDPVADDQFSAVLAAADVLLLHEWSGVAEMCVPSKLTSYFAAGRPVVAGTGSGSAASAEVRASGGGLVVPPEDPTALLAAVLRLADDPAEAEAMGRRGAHFAREVLHADRARESYVGWVEALATDRTAARGRTRRHVRPAGSRAPVPVLADEQAPAAVSLPAPGAMSSSEPLPSSGLPSGEAVPL